MQVLKIQVKHLYVFKVNTHAMFGFDNSQMQDSENLNITIDDKGNAILLAISVILQGNRSVAELTELLASISGDLREDGELSDESVLESLRNSSLQLDMPEIRQNLESRYSALGIEANIPEFESYVAAFLSYTAGEPFASTQNAIDITTTGATLTGFVNPNSASTQVFFEYGPTNNYGTEVTADQSPLNGNMGLAVQVTIGSLDPATTYHFRVKALNEHGEFVGQNYSFTTLGEASDALTNPATNINLTSATLNGRVNPNHLSTNVVFEYGTSMELGHEVPAIQSPVSGHDEVDVSADIEGLLHGTTYFYRVKAENGLGVSYANIMEFRTLGDKPTATANYADALENSARLHGKVNPNLLTTAVTFEWGTGGSFQYSATAIESPINGDSDIHVSVEISGLQANTEYQFRVKAENELGTSNSDGKTFKTFNGTVTDVEGNVYPTVIIGSQEWMAKNLRTTRYNDGSKISEDVYGIYPHELADHINSHEEMINTYGVLYYGSAIYDDRGLCPTGWHVPENYKWTELIDYLGGPQIAGIKLSQAGSNHWLGGAGTNESGFSALPGGRRDANGTYIYIRHSGSWWSSTPVSENSIISYYLFIGGSVDIGNGGTDNNFGLSVRCIKN